MNYNQSRDNKYILTAESIWEQYLLDLLECSGAIIDNHFIRLDRENLLVECEELDYFYALLEKFARELREESDQWDKHFTNLPY